MRDLTMIVVHCSDSDYDHHDNVETIREWHKARGFYDVGYHFVITKDGIRHTGRPLEKMGAHAAGFNQKSVGICLTGKNEFNEKQFNSLRMLVNYLQVKYPSIKKIIGHCEVSDKTCPNFDYKHVLRDYI